MAKKKTKVETTEKIKVQEAYEILATTQFQTELKRQLNLELNRLNAPAPEKMKWKASPAFSLMRKGFLVDEDRFFNEYLSCLYKTSKLSSGERSYIQQVGNLAFKNVSPLFEVVKCE